MTAEENPAERLHSAMFYSDKDGWEWNLSTTARQFFVTGQARTLAEALRHAGRAADKFALGVLPEKQPLAFVAWGQCQCLRCGAKWYARKKNYHTPPKRCAKCRSPYWNKPYQRTAANEKERELLLLIRAGRGG